MGKSTSNREKRLKRKQFILNTIELVKKHVTFKKSIVVFCIYYVVRFVGYLKDVYAEGGYFPNEVAITIITAFIVELGLAAYASIKDKDDSDGKDDERGTKYG